LESGDRIDLALVLSMYYSTYWSVHTASQSRQRHDHDPSELRSQSVRCEKMQ